MSWDLPADVTWPVAPTFSNVRVPYMPYNNGGSYLADFKNNGMLASQDCYHYKDLMTGSNTIPGAIWYPSFRRVIMGNSPELLAAGLNTRTFWPEARRYGQDMSQHSLLLRREWTKINAALAKWKPWEILNPGGVNLPVFLLELAELVTGTASLVRKFREMPTFLLHYVANLDFSSAISVITSLMSETQLAWSFGIAPFFSDIEKMKSNLSRLAERIASIEQLEHTLMHRIGIEQPKPEVLTTRETFIEDGGLFEWQLSRNTLISGNLQWWPSYPGYSALMGRLRQFGDALGMNLEYGILWEKIPFSFVLDWFINVDSYLSKVAGIHMDTRNFDMRATVDRFTLSTKSTYRVAYVLPGWAMYPSIGFNTESWRFTPPTNQVYEYPVASQYVRRHYSPDVSRVNGKNKYGFHQVVLSASLMRLIAPRVRDRLKGRYVPSGYVEKRVISTSNLTYDEVKKLLRLASKSRFRDNKPK